MKVLIKLNNQFYKLDIEIFHSNFNSKTRFYKRYNNYYNKLLKAKI